MMSVKSRQQGRRIVVALLVAFSALVVVAGSASARDPSKGYAAVESVDPAGHSVTLRGQVYAVRPQTDFRSATGGRGRLRDLRAMQTGMDVQLIGDVDWVYFEAASTPNGWVLTRLHVQEGIPK